MKAVYKTGTSAYIRPDYIIEKIKSAIHVARLTIRVMDVRNIFYFSDRLIEDRRWQIR